MATRSPHKRKKTAKEFKESAGPIGGAINAGGILRRGIAGKATTATGLAKGAKKLKSGKLIFEREREIHPSRLLPKKASTVTGKKDTGMLFKSKAEIANEAKKLREVDLKPSALQRLKNALKRK